MVALQTTWSWLPAIYLFLGGLSAGAFITAAVLRFAQPGRFDKVVTGGTWIAVIALAVGLLALVSEVEKPFQAINLFGSFTNFSSWMTIGAWLLLVTFIVFGLTALLSTKKVVACLGEGFAKSSAGAAKVLAGVGTPLALCVAIYTGILLGAAPAIPLWNTWILPVLFTVSALDTGVAAVAILVALSKEPGIEVVQGVLEKATIVLVILEMIILAAFVFTMRDAGYDEAVAVSMLVEGELAVQFWMLVLGVGLLVPLLAAITQVIMAKKGKHDSSVSRVAPMLGAAGALIGGFALRYVILAAGIHAAMVSPGVLQAAAGVLFYL